MCMYAHAHVAVTGASIYLQGIWFSPVIIMDMRKWQLSVHLSLTSQHVGAQVNFLQEAVFPLSELSFGFCGDLNGYGLLAYMLECFPLRSCPVIRRCGLVGVGVALQEEVCYCGGSLCGLICSR